MIYYRRGVNGKWIHADPKGSRLKYVSVSNNGTHVWGVNKNNQIYYRRGLSGKWILIPGGLKQISISGNGKHLWGISSKDEIYYSTVSFTSKATKPKSTWGSKKKSKSSWGKGGSSWGSKRNLKVLGVAKRNLKVHGLAKRNINLNLISVGKRNLKEKVPPENIGAILYGGYLGDAKYWSAKFPEGRFTTADIIKRGGKNDETSSMKVMPGFKVIAYRDNNFKGVKREYLPGDYDYSKFIGTIGNDTLSSIVVEKYTLKPKQNLKKERSSKMSLLTKR